MQPTSQHIQDTRAKHWPAHAMKFCFGMILLGQVLFLLFIFAFYYPSTLSGAFETWNSKPLITGYVEQDSVGNFGFGVHVLLAAIITGAGLLQVIPAIRNRFPVFHRWVGRTYFVTALLLALGGLWLVWVRGSYLNLTGAIGISFNGSLIILCASYAWYLARKRRFAAHRRWALRTFTVVSAVWFMRIGYMAWGMATGGAGIGNRMDGPYDYFLAFGNSLVPLLVLETYFLVAKKGNASARYAMTALLVLCGCSILAGSAGAWLVMWSPYL